MTLSPLNMENLTATGIVNEFSYKAGIISVYGPQSYNATLASDRACRLEKRFKTLAGAKRHIENLIARQS